MSRILFTNRFYAPDHSATAQLLTDLAESLAVSGKDIHIVTSRQLYEDADARLAKYESISRVNVHRIYSTRFGRHNLAGRAIDYISFYLFCFLFLIRFLKKGDVVIAKTDPPLISVFVAIAARVKGAKQINWIQDLFPEIANAIRPGTIPSPLFRILRALRNWSLHAASCNIVIGEMMREKLIGQGIQKTKVQVIHNWPIGKGSEPTQDEINEIKDRWGLSGKFVVGYSGNLGRAHEYQIFADAAASLKQNPDIVFLFIGGGYGMDRLKQLAQDKNLSNIVFKPYQPSNKLKLSLSIPDVHLISLAPTMEGLIVPSKFYGILSVARPMIFVGAQDGEIATLIKRYQLGEHVPSQSTEELKQLIIRSFNDSVHTKCSFTDNIFKTFFDSTAAIDKWQKLLA